MKNGNSLFTNGPTLHQTINGNQKSRNKQTKSNRIATNSLDTTQVQLQFMKSFFTESEKNNVRESQILAQSYQTNQKFPAEA